MFHILTGALSLRNSIALLMVVADEELEPGNPPHASDKSDALLNPIKAAQKKWTRKQAQMSNNDEVNKYENLTKLAV